LLDDEGEEGCESATASDISSEDFLTDLWLNGVGLEDELLATIQKAKTFLTRTQNRMDKFQFFISFYGKKLATTTDTVYFKVFRCWFLFLSLQSEIPSL
jgi:hypothetical protein